jgi:hypothetical protein
VRRLPEPSQATVRPLVSPDADMRPPCSVRACPLRARYVIGLRVVTDGRERRREEFRCPGHAQVFADRKGLKLPHVNEGR